MIHSVLFSIQSYWSSIFTLPQSIIREIEGVLSAFLWTGADLKHSGAKVSWANHCVPKNESGQGFRSLKEWNKAVNMKHLWAHSQKADNLWVKWVHEYRRGKGLRNAIYKLFLVAVIYSLWGERNLRIFQQKSHGVADVAGVIFDGVRAKLSSWSLVKFTTCNRRICDDWLLDFRIFDVNNR